jgi:TrmH family RNA methyltransferase
VPAQFDNLRLVLVGTRNPLNLGAAARAMSNFGFLGLRVVNPYKVAFREARSAVGASAWLKNAEEFGDLAAAVSDCTLVVGTTAVRSRELHHPLRPLKLGARLIGKKLRSHRVALVFGSERVGLSNQALSHCNWLMHIPTRERHPSMNLGQAVAVCLYELAREATASSPSATPPPASAGDLERITSLLLESLRGCGYLDPQPSLATEAKVRRLVRRLDLRGSDAEVWLGMLRQMAWKIRSRE